MTDKRHTNNNMRWPMYYTLAFAASCFLVYALQIFYRRTFIYTQAGTGDGLLQHYTVLMYYGKWLRSILSNIFFKHRFSIPDWDMGIGLGGDVAATFHYYGLGDPLNLLSVFVPARYTEILYNILVLVRLYLAGAAFWAYCRYHGYRNEMILPGTLIYVFSFYTVVLSVLHPFFLNPLVCFPLVLLGIDRIMEKGKPAVFISSCLTAAYVNFYFFYMISVLMFLYAVIRYLDLFGAGRGGKHLLCMLGKFISCYLAAVLPALPVLLPSAAVVLAGNRTGTGAEVPLFYEPVYYLKLVPAFVNASADHYAALGYTSVGLLAVVLLFGKTGKKEKLPLKVAFVIGTVFLVFPFCGHVLNGFGYAANRWVWAYCFVAALAVVDRMPQMVKNSGKLVWAALAVTLVFALPTFWYRSAGDRRKMAVSAALLVCAAAGMFFLAVLGRKWKNRNAPVWMFLGVILVNLFLNAFSFYSPYGGNDIGNQGKAGQAYENRMDGFYGLFDKTGIDSTDVRIDTVHMGFDQAGVNAAMLHGRNGTSFYFSMNNSSTSSFIRDMELPVSTDICYTDMDGRVFVEALLGCRYCVVRQGEEQYLPYGYGKLAASGDGNEEQTAFGYGNEEQTASGYGNEEQIASGYGNEEQTASGYGNENLKTSGNGYAVYESGLALPLVYTYHSFVDKEEYDRLTAVQKQQALLQACVLEEGADGMEMEREECLEFSDRRMPAVVDACSEGVEVDGNRIAVSKEGASVHISAEAAERTERYLAFQNLRYSGAGPGISDVTVTDGQMQEQFQVRSPLNVQYSNIHDVMCNLGYRERHGTGYTVSFGSVGTYSCDSMEIVDQPVDGLENLTEERRQDRVKYSVEEDAVKIETELDAPGIVYAAVPYSRKWKAYIDGRRTECHRANGFGMGIYAKSGKHYIELRYS